MMAYRIRVFSATVVAAPLLLLLGACGTTTTAFQQISAPTTRSNLGPLFLTPEKKNNGLRQESSMQVSNVFSGDDDTRRTPSLLPYTDEESTEGNMMQASLLLNTTEIVCDVQGCVAPLEDHPRALFNLEEMRDWMVNSYAGPRLLLAAVACLYGTNFPLGSIMDQALPASAASSARFLLAALALSPFAVRLHQDLIGMACIAGCFTATGYVAQSVALVDTSPATVSFLGAATVIWCPFLEWLVDKKPMSWEARPQTWIAGAACLMGVGILELCGEGGLQDAFATIGMGDGLALLQAVGFGTGLFMSEKMMNKHPDQALPITSVMVATTALISMVWALSDGWIGSTPGWESMTLPTMLMDPSMHDVAAAVVWTGLLSTSLNFFLEVFGLGKVPSGEASVILATEPLWAAVFAAVILQETFGWNDYVGGMFIVAACLINSMKQDDLQKLMSFGGAEEERI